MPPNNEKLSTGERKILERLDQMQAALDDIAEQIQTLKEEKE